MIFSKTFEDHVSRLESVFEKLSEHNLKLKPSKCEFFRSSVTYLGHVVGEHGISADPEMLSAVIEWKARENIKELRQFLGFSSYYRRFIKDYSQIAQPLNSLLQGHSTVKKG
jgi:hypothetical protein